jgi:GT2 family glycosyltransferase
LTTSVIVVAYRRHLWLERCLQSVLDQADEVVLIDNASPDGVVSAAGHKLGVRVETLPTNTGFAGGVNAGLGRARGDLVALLNDDAVAEPGWLASATRVLEDPAVAAVGPKILFPWPYAEICLDEDPHFDPPDPRPLGRFVQRVEVDGINIPLEALLGPGLHDLEALVLDGSVQRRWRWGTGTGAIFVPVPEETTGSTVSVDGESVPVHRLVNLVSNAGSYLSARGHGGDFGFASPDTGIFDSAAERFATTGAAMVVRAETFARVGGFAPSFFAYYEDFDWCWRARLAGLAARYDPTTVVRHVGGASSGGPGNDRVRYLSARNRIHTLARNAPLAVLWSELRSPVDRPQSGMALPLGKRVTQGLIERRGLARQWSEKPRAIWSAWAGRDEGWPTQTSS